MALNKHSALSFIKSNMLWGVLVVLLTLIHLYPSFFNGYPYVFSDTGTYIRSGFTYDVPVDRPIFYGLFVHISSFGQTLWFTVLFQSLLMCGSLILLQKMLLANSYKSAKTLQVIAVVSLFFLAKFSALPFLSSTLLPDVFTAFPLFILLILLLKQNITTWQYICLFIIYIFITLTHYSNLICLTLILPLVELARMVFKIKYLSRKRIIIAGGLTLSMWLIAPAFNSAFNYGFKMSKGSHVFTMATFIDNGLLDKYLHESPHASQYPLYQFKDSLPPNSGEFLWNFNKSPLYKTGGWDNSKDEYSAIVKDIIFSKEYFFRWLKWCVTSTFKQLTYNEFGLDIDVAYKDEGSAPRISMVSYYPEELYQYDHSRQNNNNTGFNFKDMSRAQNLLIIAGIVLIIVLLILHGLEQPVMFASVVAVLYILINAVTVASLSAIVDRYNSRISWILIFFAITGVLAYLPVYKRYFIKSNH